MPRESVVFACYFVVLILLFSIRIFRNSVVGHECFFFNTTAFTSSPDDGPKLHRKFLGNN